MQRKKAENHRQVHGKEKRIFYNKDINSDSKEEKEMKKKLVSALLVAAMCVTALAGCGNNADEAKTEDTVKDEAEAEEEVSAGSNTVVGADDASTVLKWALWDAKTATYWEAVAQAYVDENPDVRIEMTDLGSADYQTVLSTELSGSGSDFDVVTIKDVPGYATLVSKGVLEPLNERIEADGIDLSAYNGMTEQVTVDGELYELPLISVYCTTTRICLTLRELTIRQMI